jgi:hypothetical protein
VLVASVDRHTFTKRPFKIVLMDEEFLRQKAVELGRVAGERPAQARIRGDRLCALLDLGVMKRHDRGHQRSHLPRVVCHAALEHGLRHRGEGLLPWLAGRRAGAAGEQNTNQEASQFAHASSLSKRGATSSH